MIRFLISIMLLFSFQSKTSLPTVEINSVSMDILTFARVDCSRFEDAFEKKEMKKTTVKGKAKIDELISELGKLKIQDRKNATDTRATITLTYSDHTERICADKFSICTNGTCYEITDKLKELIWK